MQFSFGQLPESAGRFCGQESMLPIMTQLSYKDPRREVVLRVEAIDEREARVSSECVTLCPRVGFALPAL